MMEDKILDRAGRRFTPSEVFPESGALTLGPTRMSMEIAGNLTLVLIVIGSTSVDQAPAHMS